MEDRECNKCKELKPLSLFHKDNRTSTGRGTTCLSCVALTTSLYRQKHYYRLRAEKFGITEKELLEMYETQGYSCAGCGIHEDDLPKKLHIDHCHTSNKVRGLLCNDCNLTLGFSKDNIKTLMNLAKYLNRGNTDE